MNSGRFETKTSQENYDELSDQRSQQRVRALCLKNDKHLLLRVRLDGLFSSGFQCFRVF